MASSFGSRARRETVDIAEPCRDSVTQSIDPAAGVRRRERVHRQPGAHPTAVRPESDWRHRGEPAAGKVTNRRSCGARSPHEHAGSKPIGAHYGVVPAVHVNDTPVHIGSLRAEQE